VGIQCAVAEKLVRRAVVLGSAALGDDVDLAAAGAASSAEYVPVWTWELTDGVRGETEHLGIERRVRVRWPVNQEVVRVWDGCRRLVSGRWLARDASRAGSCCPPARRARGESRER